MPADFTAQQAMLGLGQCERLCQRTSREIQELARLGGWSALPSQPLEFSLGCAMNMLIIAQAKSYNIEPHFVRNWLPGLRSEALLTLGVVDRHWIFNGNDEDRQRFTELFWTSNERIRDRVAPIIKCSTNSATRQLFVYSGPHVVEVKSAGEPPVHPDLTPIFVIEASYIAERVHSVLDGPAFIATTKDRVSTW